MATQISRTIGSGGDHADLDAFLAAVPANLVTADQQWTAVLLDGTALTKAASTVIGSRTTNATCYIEITGQTIGSASLTVTGAVIGLDVNQSYTRISKIRVISTNNTASAQPCIYVRSTATNCDVNQCVADGYGQNVALRGVFMMNGATSHVRNTLIIQRATDAAATICQIANGAKATNVTALSLGVQMTAGIVGATLAATLKNIYVGNVVAAEGGSPAATKTTCASSAAATGWTSVPFSTATFVNLTSDFRLASGSTLIDAGTNDATFAATDADGTVRPQGASTDIGAYEYSAGSADATAPGATLTSTSTLTGGAASGEGAASAPGATLTATSTLTGGVATATNFGTFTTLPMKNNTGTLLASETGITLNIYNSTTGALIVQKTGVTTNASGIAEVTDALILPATTYAYEPVLTGGRRRLPTKAAT